MPQERRTNVESLIIVCCHAIWLGGVSKGWDESEWLIEPFQTGETPTFISHIKRGLDELAIDKNRLLVFSGGVTKWSKTTLSEATSYRNLALANDLFGHPASLASLILTDDNATDSFQNLLFPLVLFASHVTGCPKVKEPEHQSTKERRESPKHMTIIGHEFKRRRFEELHLSAIRWTRDPVHFKYVGIDPPMNAEKRLQVLNGEMLRGFGAWQKDMYGTREILVSKRMSRGWSDERKKEVEMDVSRGWQHSIFKNSILDLLSWNGGANGQEIYPNRLPWDGLDN